MPCSLNMAFEAFDFRSSIAVLKEPFGDWHGLAQATERASSLLWLRRQDGSWKPTAMGSDGHHCRPTIRRVFQVQGRNTRSDGWYLLTTSAVSAVPHCIVQVSFWATSDFQESLDGNQEQAGDAGETDSTSHTGSGHGGPAPLHAAP